MLCYSRLLAKTSAARVPMVRDISPQVLYPGRHAFGFHLVKNYSVQQTENFTTSGFCLLTIHAISPELYLISCRFSKTGSMVKLGLYEILVSVKTIIHLFYLLLGAF